MTNPYDPPTSEDQEPEQRPSGPHFTPLAKAGVWVLVALVAVAVASASQLIFVIVLAALVVCYLILAAIDFVTRNR